MTWDRLQAEDSLTYPLEQEGDPGTPVIFTESFPRPGGRGLFVPASFSRADELPDEEYPWIFITGRELEHWHTGSMTRHASKLDAIQHDPVIYLNPKLMQSLNVEVGDTVTVESRRGKISAYARPDLGLAENSSFMAFCYNEASANLLTNEALDPYAKIPEFKFCAVRLSAGGTVDIRIQ
jgi:formate dehydrogenase major subunit